MSPSEANPKPTKQRILAACLCVLALITLSVQYVSPILMSKGIPTRSLGGQSTTAKLADLVVGINEVLPFIVHPLVFLAACVLARESLDFLAVKLSILACAVSMAGSLVMFVTSGEIPVVH